MCLYPKIIQNRKYIQNKKNGGNIPAFFDERVLHVPVGCGNCIECRKQKAREWQVRLSEDIKTHKNGVFVTLTFNNESIKELTQACRAKTATQLENTKKLLPTPETNKTIQKLAYQMTGYGLDNAIATLATRRLLEKVRKKTKKSLRHWLVTELGHSGTENVHLHGIIWTDKPKLIEEAWKYGFIWKGNNKNGTIENYVNEKTINYIIKYVTKTDLLHPNYKPIILTSSGIGSNYLKTFNSTKNKYNSTNTNETYRTQTGTKLALPTYYRNKLYSDEEKEQLWLNKLDKNERWILGQRIDISNNEKLYWAVLKEAQRKNKELGYGDNIKNWSEIKYEHERRKLMQAERLNNRNTDKEPPAL